MKEKDRRKLEDESKYIIGEGMTPSEMVHIRGEIKDPELWKSAVKYQFIYSILGLVLGLCCIVGGIILFLNGITGSTDWTLKIWGSESIINDAGAGVVLFIVGLFVVFITRYSIKATKK